MGDYGNSLLCRYVSVEHLDKVTIIKKLADGEHD